MEWIKVLNRHVLFEYNDLSPAEFQAWIKVMALTAMMEKEPTREQMLKFVNHQTLRSLSEKVQQHGSDLSAILQKVLSDVSGVLQMRDSAKKRMQKIRGVEPAVTPNVQQTFTGDKIREDKIREDKIIKEKKTAKPEKIKFLDSVILTQEQHDKLKATPGLDVDLAIEKLDYSITGLGRKYSDHYKVILNWHKRGFIKKGENNVSTIGTNSNRSFTAKPSSINEAGDEAIREMLERVAIIKKNAADKALREAEGNDVPDF